MAFEHRGIAQIVVERDARVVDQHVKRLNLRDGIPDVRGVGHVQRHGDDALIGRSDRSARAGVHPPRSPAQCFLHEGPANPAIGAVSERFGVLLVGVAADGQGRVPILADAECRDESAPGAVMIKHAVAQEVDPRAITVGAARVGPHRAGQLRIE